MDGMNEACRMKQFNCLVLLSHDPIHELLLAIKAIADQVMQPGRKIGLRCLEVRQILISVTTGSQSGSGV